MENVDETEKLRELVREEITKFFGFLRGKHDGADLRYVAKLSAAVDSSIFAATHMQGVPTFRRPRDLLTHGMKRRTIEGLILEFGVASGKTVNHLASLMGGGGKVYGFDSFEGLPEDWRPDFKVGHFAQNLPPVADNVELIVGWFDKTVEPFMQSHPENVSFLHVDCDLYSSTRSIFHALRGRIVPGTVIVFDEFFNYVGWREHEYKAFLEFLSQDGLGFEYFGYVPSRQQVGVQIK